MKILDALLLLKEQAVKGCVDYPDFGICYNLSKLTDSDMKTYSFVGANCQDWEYFSGRLAYPVKDFGYSCPWKSEQLELRLSLLDHLIARAQEQGV